MRPFTEAEMNRAQMFAERSCYDECIHIEHTVTTDPETNEQEEQFIIGRTLPCIYQIGRSFETKNITPSVQVQASILLPWRFQGLIGAEDRIRIVKRKGQQLVIPEELELDGEPQTGNVYIVVNVTKTKFG